MESQVSPNTIQERAEAVESTLAAEKVAAEKAAADKLIADKPVEQTHVDPEKIAADKTVVDAQKSAVKPADKVEIAKAPNDPIELRKWATKASQENAALRDEMKALKAAIEKLSKKPIDYKELAKNPEAIQKQIELERQEAIAEMQEQLQEKTTLAVTNETVVERMKREQDIEHYPEWKRLFPIIQNLAANTDGRINFNQAPGLVLDAMYELALQMAPSQIAPVVPQKVEQVVPVIPTKTPEEIAALEAAAEKRGFEKAQEALRNEQNGAGIGSTGKGGKRSSGVSKEALQTMPLKELKSLISKE